MIPAILNWPSFPAVVSCTKLLFCLSTAVPAAEYLFIHQAFRAQGVFSGRVMALNDTSPRTLPVPVENLLYSYPAFLGIHLLRLVLCGGLLVLPEGASGYLLGGLVALNLLFLYRNSLGSDGSDQMNLIIGIALTVLYLQPGNVGLTHLSLFFIAAQSILAYFVAGVAKLLSAEWRSGLAVRAIMNTRTYGSLAISRYLSQGNRRGVNLALCWSVILMEMAFPLVLVLPAPYCWLLLAWGICFHLYNAVVMGLNVFFWAFLATYPSIILLRLTIGR